MDGALKQEIQDTIKRVVTIFTQQYTKHYLLAMIQLIEEEANKEPEPDYQLESRPPTTEVFKEGYLEKESLYLKKWNKRYVVFRSDYNVDYFDNEAEAHKEKKKPSTINLSGYSIVDDPNQGVLVRLKRLAEKMGVDFSNLPKPKEYPPFTIEIYHSRRPCLYFKAENQEQFESWLQQFRHAAWHATPLTWDDPAHKIAFPKAIRHTRWELGRWGWYYGGGTEEQYLSDLIADELEYDIISRVYSGLPGPYFIRSKIRNMVLKTIDTMILAVVKPGWAAMRKGVEELKPKVEPVMKSSLEPYFKAKAEIVEKMKDAAMGVLEPIIREKVNPHLGKIIAIIKSPLVDAFAETARLFDEKVTKWEPKDDPKKHFHELDWFGRSWWELRTALRIPDQMYEPLWLLREVFPDIYPWHLIWKAHDHIYKLADKAIYTFEQGIEKGGNTETVKGEVLAKFRHDAEIVTLDYFGKILSIIVTPPVEVVAIPAGKAIVDPLQNLVPEPLQQFLDLNQMYQDLYQGIIDDSIQVVLRADA